MLDVLDQALYDALSADTDLSNFVGNRIYANQAPPDTPHPLVIFNMHQGGPQKTSPRLALDVTYRVECVADTRADAASGLGFIHAALDGQTLAISGWSNYDTAASGWTVDVVTIEGQQFFRAGTEVRVRADQD